MLKEMSMTMRIILGLFISGVVFIIAVVAFVLWQIFITYNNVGANSESSIMARWNEQQSVFSNSGQKIMEIAQVPKMYTDDLTKVMKTAVTAKYGAEGSKAVFQWFTDAKIDLPQEMYTKIQQVIDASRNDVMNIEKQRIDVCRQYDKIEQRNPDGWFLHMAGYPKIYAKEPNICKPVIDDRTSEAFTTMRQKTIQLRAPEAEAAAK